MKYIGSIAVSVAALALFAACNNGQQYAPAIGGTATQEAQSVSLPGSDDSARLFQVTPEAKVLCKAQKVRMPGEITLLAAAGEVRNGRFASSSKHDDSVWATFYIEQSTSPTPTPAPSSAPLKPYYVYYGSYTLKNGSSGCALLLTTQHGEPIVKTSNFNAIMAGAPRILVNYTITEINAGFATITTGKLSAKGGTGTVILHPHAKSMADGSSSNGTVTGTIKFIGRAAFK